MLALDGPEVADAAADVGADAPGRLLAVAVVELLPALDEPRVVDRLVGGRDGEVDEGAHLAGLLLLDELERVEALDLGADLDGELLGVELLDVADAALTRHQRRPGLPHGVPAGRDQTQARYHYATFQSFCSSEGVRPARGRTSVP